MKKDHYMRTIALRLKPLEHVYPVFLFADFEQRTLILISTDFRSYVLMKAVTAPHYSTSSGSFRSKTISARDSSRSAQIKFLMGLRRTAFSGNNFDFGTSIEVKRTVSEYHNQNYCQRVLHSKRLRRSVKI